LTVTESEASRAAKDLAENYYIYCVACRRKIVFYEWSRHSVSSEHLNNELALQEKELKRDSKGWVEKYWPATGETTRWCPKCDQPVRNADFYAHLEGHRVKKAKKNKQPIF